jgi:hypothetical protein
VSGGKIEGTSWPGNGPKSHRRRKTRSRKKKKKQEEEEEEELNSRIRATLRVRESLS